MDKTARKTQNLFTAMAICLHQGVAPTHIYELFILGDSVIA